jgi:hypothetical protein
MPVETMASAKAASPAKRRVFFVHHRFLSCGDVFREGLAHAAQDLELSSESAYWDDPALPDRVRGFDPDLLLVVHGRNFVRRWGRTFAGRRSAVWLVDEPYEVDDSSRYSSSFGHVFVNDPATLARHRSAHYLPLCHDPRAHFRGAGERRYAVGFVGGGNATRERMLGALAARGRLDYVVGGPWRGDALRRACLSPNVPPARTADLYRATRIVINVFRDIHHFNRKAIAGVSLNPRVYEALACGALVVSEKRPEIETVVPELPTFATTEELVHVVEDLLSHPDRMEDLRVACARRLADATYAARLQTVMELTSGSTSVRPDSVPFSRREVAVVAPSQPGAPAILTGGAWEVCPPLEYRESEGTLVFSKTPAAAPASERGLASCSPYDEVDLSFEVLVTPGSTFIAKVHQADKLDQGSNSYHLFCAGTRAYLARHNHILSWVQVARGQWERLRITCGRGELSVYSGDSRACTVRDDRLRRGYAFLGLKGGEVRLRNVHLGTLASMAGPLAVAAPATSAPEAETVLHVPERAAATPPRVSIVTTVYDRTDCLRRCLRSVKALTFKDYEHIVVSDHPPASVVDEIARIVREEDDGRISYVDLPRRFQNWGIAPAAAGLRRGRGEFVSFLSDDNGYLPDHLAALVDVLDRDPALGFAYSSCLYGGRAVLSHPVPRPGAIDLGQPLFRRALFAAHLGGGLPFNMIAWDWALIDAFIKRGVRWKHVDRPSFVFRLAAYPRLIPA